MVIEETFDRDLRAMVATGVVLQTGIDRARFESLPAEEQRLVASAVVRRKTQFAAGRILARTALTRLGAPVHALLKRADGSPDWPASVCGSISHTNGIAAAVVAYRRDFVGVGIDLETGTSFPSEAIGSVLTHAEQRLAITDAMRLRTFCAKESVYKCLSPLGAVDLEFLDIELSWQVDTFTARATDPARAGTALVDALRVLCGRSAQRGEHTAAFACLKAPISG